MISRIKKLESINKNKNFKVMIVIEEEDGELYHLGGEKLTNKEVELLNKNDGELIDVDIEEDEQEFPNIIIKKASTLKKSSTDSNNKLR